MDKCKVCNNDIAKSAKICPSCGAKIKKPFYKRVWFIVIVVIFVFVGVWSAIGSDKSATTSKEETNTTAQTNKESTTTDKEKDETGEQEYYMKENVKVGDVIYNVSAITTKSKVGPQYFSSKAKGTYLLVKVKVTNKGSESITVDSSFFKLLADGKEFEADSMASTYANSKKDGTNTFLESVNPDVSLTGYIAFDVSKSLAKNKNLKLQVQTGAWGTEKGTINLKTK